LRQVEHGGDIYGNTGVRLDFSVNTNPLGMPKEVRAALVAGVEEFARYPDPDCRELTAAIARRENVPEEWILCGNGAADLIYRICYALKPRRGLIFPPTFSEYERAMRQAGCEVAYGRLAGGEDIVFLCHPNNPTGLLAPGDLLERVLQSGTTVVVDECFLDFTEGVSVKGKLKEIPGLVVLKAFTKIYAMAGLRLGYVLCSDRRLLNKIRDAAQCWSVSVPAQIAGAAALACADWVSKTRRFVSEERKFLARELAGLGVEVFPSDANYLLLRCETPLYWPLLQKGVLIRSCGNFHGLDESYYRIGIKQRTENMSLIQAVKEVLHG
jgi:threonine-phosphate decarboxylase